MSERPCQEDIGLRMFVDRANETAELPEVFAAHSLTPSAPAQLDPARITANREAWINAWTQVVLR